MNLQIECTRDVPQPIKGTTQSDRLSPAGHLAHDSPKLFFQIADFRPSIWMGAVLVISGLFHLAVLWVSSAEWNGPLSPRKPALIGVSAGVTVWSIAWVLTKIFPWRNDRFIANLMALCLILEVGLITLQYWRGVPSHFNHGNMIDAVIETAMLGFILVVTLRNCLSRLAITSTSTNRRNTGNCNLCRTVVPAGLLRSWSVCDHRWRDKHRQWQVL